MTPYEWVRKYPEAVVLTAVGASSLVLVKLLSLTDVSKLGNENVMQLMGIVLAGQLAVLVLTVQAVLDLRVQVLGSIEAASLGPEIDWVLSELESNTLFTFIEFALMFFMALAFESKQELLAIKLPLDSTVADAFCACKITFVIISYLVMWDSIGSLCGIGVAMTALKRITAARRCREL